LPITENNQHYIEHLAELRKRLILIFIIFFISLLVSLVFVNQLLLWLTRDLEDKLQFLGPTDILWVYLTLASIFAIAVTIPFAGYQLWRFIAPGLQQHERRASLMYIPALAFLFILGIAFGYFVIYPMVLSFLTHLAGEQFELNYTADRYIRFILNMTLPFGLLFEMPVIVMFLTTLGILNPHRLAKMRKVAYFILTITAVMITPPDIVSDILVIVPLFFLYEMSLLLSRVVYRRKLSNERSS
jgi:sec-independent protein translocase protein TatC